MFSNYVWHAQQIDLRRILRSLIQECWNWRHQYLKNVWYWRHKWGKLICGVNENNQNIIILIWNIYSGNLFLWRLLTHWGRVTHICVSKQTIIGSDNGLSPGRHQAICWTNAEILLIGTLGTNFSEILIGIQIFAFKKIHLKMSSAKWRPFCLDLNVLIPLLLLLLFIRDHARNFETGVLGCHGFWRMGFCVESRGLETMVNRFQN